MGLTAQQFEYAVMSLGSIAHAIRELPLDDMLEAIKQTKEKKALHRPTASQEQNVNDIEATALAAVELRKVAIEIAERKNQETTRRILVPGSPGWH